ncbi:SDR family NAD(P)-dependent oxidoreductase [Pacificimonas pallii]|uniref:SDR family NAD(P)-dependent oxidoreductase n=1 Tax=Pacificimonas pallii TaxID=2827236 RepID=UPI0034E292F2
MKPSADTLSGQTVWITGASSGIGRALAIAMSAAGANIILSGRRAEALNAAAADCAGETLILPFEATDYDALPGIVAEASTWQGTPDILVNNAGISQRALGVDTDFDVYRRLMEVDFFAPLRLTQLLLPAMLERGSGTLIQVASLAGKIGVPMRTGYCAAKHALMGYSDALRAENARHGLNVLSVTPGFVQTDIAANAVDGKGNRYGPNDDPVNHGITAEMAADQIIAALNAGKREITVGTAQERANAVMARLLPGMTMDRMAERTGA